MDPESGDFIEARVFRREHLETGARMHGPALVVEDETTTVVGRNWDARVNAVGYLILERLE